MMIETTEMVETIIVNLIHFVNASWYAKEKPVGCYSLQKSMKAHVNEHTSEKIMFGPFASLFEETLSALLSHGCHGVLAMEYYGMLGSTSSPWYPESLLRYKAFL